MGKTALVLITDGTEEMEAVIVVDVLRRAQVDVTLAGLSEDASKAATCSRNVRITPDVSLKEAAVKEHYDVIVLPGGGPGAKAFASSDAVKNVLEQQEKTGGLIAAVCAAPIALKAHGICKGKQLTSYPAFKEELSQDYVYSEDRVVVDGNLVTSRGPGTCFEFAAKLVEILLDKETSEKVSDAMLC